MSHSCPSCGQVCYCGGDIDDIHLDGTIDELLCGHCEDDGEEDRDDLFQLLEDRDKEN